MQRSTEDRKTLADFPDFFGRPRIRVLVTLDSDDVVERMAGLVHQPGNHPIGVCRIRPIIIDQQRRTGVGLTRFSEGSLKKSRPAHAADRFCQDGRVFTWFGATVVRGLIHHIPEIDYALEPGHASLDATELQAHRRFRVPRQPRRVSPVPCQRMPLHGDLVLLAPRRNSFGFGVLGLPLLRLIPPPVERQSRVVQEGHKLLFVRRVFLRGAASVQHEDVRPEQECVACLFEADTCPFS